METNRIDNVAVGTDNLGQNELKTGRLRTKVLIVCGLAALFCLGAMTILLAEIGGPSDSSVRGRTELRTVQRQAAVRDGEAVRNETGFAGD